jgi:UDP-N-acetylglucosamine:LPS N-acetylglucosamine transferase
VNDEDFDADALVAAADLLADEGTLAAMSIAARSFGRPGAADAVAELILAAAEHRPLPEQVEIERISRGLAG